jgi:hypothetical protein
MITHPVLLNINIEGRIKGPFKHLKQNEAVSRFGLLYLRRCHFKRVAILI